MRELNCAWEKLTASRITPTCLGTASLADVLLRHGLALRTGGCVEKNIKRESRVVVSNGRAGRDRKSPNNRLGERKRCGLATANPDWPERRDR